MGDLEVATEELMDLGKKVKDLGSDLKEGDGHADYDPYDLALTLNHVLGSAEGVVENGHVELANQMPELRRVRRGPVALDMEGANTEVPGTFVDFVVPVSDESLLVLAFSTTTEPVRDELVALFDAIASTLRTS